VTRCWSFFRWSFWYWMWGVPGAVLSTPMLAISKIICDRVRPLMAFGHFMEG
jgi:predicted PurR-regulated permease PerM